MKLETVLFFFFQILRFEIGGCGLSMDVAYTQTFTVVVNYSDNRTNLDSIIM